MRDALRATGCGVLALLLGLGHGGMLAQGVAGRGGGLIGVWLLMLVGIFIKLLGRGGNQYGRKQLFYL